MDSWLRLQEVAALLNRYGIVLRNLKENQAKVKKNEELENLLKEIEDEIKQVAQEQEEEFIQNPKADITTVVVFLPRRLL